MPYPVAPLVGNITISLNLLFEMADCLEFENLLLAFSWAS